MTKTSITFWLDDVFAQPWKLMQFCVVGVMLWLATVFAHPTNTFARSATYDLMADLASENAWAMTFASIGIVYAVSLFQKWRIATLSLGLISFIVLSTVGVCFLIGGGFWTPGAGLYGVLAVQSLMTTLHGIFTWRDV